MTGYEKRTDFAREGLDEAQARLSRERFGENRMTKQKQRGFWRRFFSNLNDPVIRILLGALAVNLLLVFQHADWVETVGIAVAVFLATLISTLSECSSNRAFARISAESSEVLCRVRRAGKLQSIPISQVAVGDVVLLSAGDAIPADGLLLSGRLRVDQAAMTGESREVEKKSTSNPSVDPSAPSALLRGCTVTHGEGVLGVTAVGDATLLGQITREVQSETRDSPLKLRLAKLARQISVLGYVAAVLVALAYLFHGFLLDSGMRWEIIRLKLASPSYLFSKLLHAFTLGLTVIVVAVPEGLPMMIAVVLSSNIRKMMRDQVLVRRPVGIESAGSMDLLFTDKTGTLTEGAMKLTSFLLPNGERLSELSALRNKPLGRLLSLTCRGGEAELDAEGRAIGGNATARALLEAATVLDEPMGERISDRLPFDSARKYAAVTYRGERRLTCIVGAPERLLPFVSSAVGKEGERIALSKRSVEVFLREMTSTGGRCLLLTASAQGISASMHEGGIRGDLVLLGAVCLSDPIRAEAADAVRDLHGAGVQVVMVTGDGRETAGAIAKACGMFKKGRDLILTSDELATLSDARLKELLPSLAVVARALPTDKSRLVRVAQEMGRVTGMTGDGINDAPALKRADVGFAMGGGTQVAKDAGDIVILDNNLASIVRAVLYGRTVFKSIRKFITLQLTMNFSAVGVTVICPFLGIDSPVTVVQMLWINLIMDTLGGLAFAGEPPLAEYMKERPKRREESILNRYMVGQIAILGGFTVALCLLFLKLPSVAACFRPSENGIYHLTAFFALFIFSSVFNCFNARTDRLNLTAGLRENRVFLLIMGAVLFIQILFVYLGGSVLRTAPLTASELLVTFSFSLAVLPFDFLRKVIRKRFHPRGGY